MTVKQYNAVVTFCTLEGYDMGTEKQMTEKEKYESVFQKYGELYKIEKQVGCEVDLRLLDDKQFVCYGGKNFYYLLTPKEREPLFTRQLNNETNAIKLRCIHNI